MVQPKNTTKLTDEAKEIVVRASRSRGLDQKQVTSRVLEWFDERDDVLQAIILRQLDPKSVPDLKARVLRSFGIS